MLRRDCRRIYSRTLSQWFLLPLETSISPWQVLTTESSDIRKKALGQGWSGAWDIPGTWPPPWGTWLRAGLSVSSVIATSTLLSHFPLCSKIVIVISQNEISGCPLNHVVRDQHWLFPELPMGHTEKGARTACFRDSGMLAPGHSDDTFVSFPISWAWTRRHAFPWLQHRGVRQILAPNRRLSLWTFECVCVCCLSLCILCYVLCLCSSPSYTVLVRIWSNGVWINALSQQQWGGRVFKLWTSFTDSVILLSSAQSEQSRLSLVELSSNSAEVSITRPGMRTHYDAEKAGRYRWAQEWGGREEECGNYCVSKKAYSKALR